MTIRHTTAAPVASAFLVASAILGSFPAKADESNRAGHPDHYATEEPVVCDWVGTDTEIEQQTRWECLESATGYVRVAISSTRVENQEHNMLQNAFRQLHSVLIAISQHELPKTEPVTMLEMATESPKISLSSR